MKEQIRTLLQPTDDETHWYKTVMALDANAAEPILSDILRNDQETEYVRRQAALMLGVFKDSAASAALVHALQAPEYLVRAQAVQALGQLPALSDDTVRQLTQCLQDANAYVRECAIKALGNLQRLDAAPALAQVREHDDAAHVRALAAKTIQQLNESSP